MLEYGMPALRHLLLPALVLLASGPFRLAAQPAPPTLLVQITVDQLVPGYFDRFGSQLTGGLKRFATQGAFFTNAQHDHATTETAPGHATLWSGRTPAHHGIVLNEIGVADAQAPLLFGRGGGASPWRFRGTALFDWIRTREPFSRALSVSRKDRGAILPLGKAKQQVYWYSLDGRFTTSRYYADTLPAWVQRFNARNPVTPYLGARWELLLPESAYPEPDSVPIESEGKRFTFPHELEKDPRTGSYNFTEFPWMDDLTVDFALDGVQALDLGKGPTLDVLAVSLSTTDAIGHRYGPDSKEIHDQILRLDRYLGQFLDSLLALRGRDRVLIALTADHGVQPIPELRSAWYRNHDAQRVDAAPAWRVVNAALRRAGVDSTAVDSDDGFRVVDPEAFRRANVDPDAIARVWVQELRKMNGVARADLLTDLARADTVTDVTARRWLHQFAPDGPIRAVVSLEPRAGEARVVDMAPTLAQRLGIRPLERLDGVPLTLYP